MTRTAFLLFIMSGIMFGLSGCTTVSYVAQSLGGHVQIMTARKSVDKLIASPSTPAPLRSQMQAAASIRQFATDELDLPDNSSYRSYADIGRDYVTWAVFAAPEFSLVPRVWCFPVFGCVPYRGYFSPEAAVAYARDLKGQGLDVHVSGVTAYSTLGWSSDPLLSTMFRHDRTYLAGLVFHELAHQRVYIEGDSAFNEAFAVAVETTGVERWLQSNGDSEGLRSYRTDQQRDKDFLGLIARTRDELQAIYQAASPPERKRASKAAAIDRLRARYRRMRDGRWNGYSGYDGWIDRPINNAKLAATAVYSDLVPAFLRLFQICDGEYPRFYAAVRRIGSIGRGQRIEALKSAETCE